MSGGEVAEGVMSGGEVADGVMSGGEVAEGVMSGGEVAEGVKSGGEVAEDAILCVEGVMSGEEVAEGVMSDREVAEGMTFDIVESCEENISLFEKGYGFENILDLVSMKSGDLFKRDEESVKESVKPVDLNLSTLRRLPTADNVKERVSFWLDNVKSSSVSQEKKPEYEGQRKRTPNKKVKKQAIETIEITLQIDQTLKCFRSLFIIAIEQNVNKHTNFKEPTYIFPISVNDLFNNKIIHMYLYERSGKSYPEAYLKTRFIQVTP